MLVLVLTLPPSNEAMATCRPWSSCDPDLNPAGSWVGDGSLPGAASLPGMSYTTRLPKPRPSTLLHRSLLSSHTQLDSPRKYRPGGEALGREATAPCTASLYICAWASFSSCSVSW